MHPQPFAVQRWPLLAFLSIVLLAACGKPKDEEKQNRPPAAFTISVSNVTFNSATLNWTAATDPDNEAVTYSVELNGQNVTSGLSVTTYNLTALQSNIRYAGKVKATDASGNSTTVDFSLNTSDTPAPSDFTLRLDASSNKSLTLAWTASTLPTGAAVTYDVFIVTTLKVGGINQTQYVLQGLQAATTYAVKVVAKSPDGKTTEKQLSAQTAANNAPQVFAAQEVEHGYSYIKIKWAAASDADGDSLSYFIKRGSTILPFTAVPVGGFYTHVESGYNPSTSYTLTVMAKDAYGGEALSNAVQATTNNGPASNFLFTAKNSGSDVELEWIQAYNVQFNPAASSYFINGVEKSMAGVQVNFMNLGAQGLYTKITLPGSEFPTNTQRSIKLKLSYGANETPAQSRTVNHTRYTYSPSSATVTSAVLKKFSNGDHGITIKFTNDIISDYTTWTVTEIKLYDCIQPNTISLSFASGQTVGSVYGAVTEEDYNYLSPRTHDGYIVVHDAGGYHRLNFVYTVQ